MNAAPHDGQIEPLNTSAVSDDERRRRQRAALEGPAAPPASEQSAQDIADAIDALDLAMTAREEGLRPYE